MKRTIVGIYVWQGKAYLPVQAQFESGILADVEPVYTAELNIEDMVSAVEKVKAAGLPRLPRPTKEEMHNRTSPILKATGLSSWKQLARSGTAYNISQTEKEVRVDMSRVDKKGRWEFDVEKVRLFPPDTPLPAIVAVILEDIQSRPELWSGELPPK